MTDVEKPRVTAFWVAMLALAGFGFVVARMISPQWSVYTQYNYGWAVPFLCLYLLWQRWQDRPVPEPRRAGVALAGLAVCMTLLMPTRIIVEANPIWRAASWAMALQFVGLALATLYLAGGRPWVKHFGFPILFFLVAIPWPSQWENAVVQNLMRINTAIVVEVMTLVGVPAVQAGNVIEISTGKVGIDEACSGIRSMQATLMIALFFGELYRLAAGRRSGLLLAGFALAFVCNMARTFVLVGVAARSGVGALDNWHDPTGIAILLVCFTGLWAVAVKLRGVAKAPESPSRENIGWPQLRPQFVPGALLLGLAVVEGGNAGWFSLRERADPQLSNWAVRWPTDKANLREVELSQRVRTEMKFNEGKAMGWTEGDGTVWQLFYFRWGPAVTLQERVVVQFAKTHRPEICLPATGLQLREQRSPQDFDADGLLLPFRAYRFEDRGLPLHVYYCAWEDGTRGMPANMRENSATRLAAARAGSRSVSQRVLEIAVWGYRTTGEADAALRRQLPQLIQH